MGSEQVAPEPSVMLCLPFQVLCGLQAGPLKGGSVYDPRMFRVKIRISKANRKEYCLGAFKFTLFICSIF